MLVGRSGTELAYEVLERSKIEISRVKPRYTQNRSEEFGTGWALAHYQWATAMRFEEIARYVSIEDVMTLYSPYHEMDIRQFVDRRNERYKAHIPPYGKKIEHIDFRFYML